MTVSKTSLAAAGLLALGCVQMLGDLTGNRVLKGIGAASHASPAPKVFTAHQGFETFSSRFFLHLETGGQPHSLELTPATYAAIAGPYNRRNAYGAAISYGPVLMASPATRPLFEATSRFALCGDAPVLRELGIDPAQLSAPVRVELRPRDARSANSHWQLEYTVTCHKETNV